MITTGQKAWREKAAPHRLSAEDKRLIIEGAESGLTMTEMAKEFNVAISTISRVVNQYQKESRDERGIESRTTKIVESQHSSKMDINGEISHEP